MNCQYPRIRLLNRFLWTLSLSASIEIKLNILTYTIILSIFRRRSLLDRGCTMTFLRYSVYTYIMYGIHTTRLQEMHHSDRPSMHVGPNSNGIEKRTKPSRLPCIYHLHH